MNKLGSSKFDPLSYVNYPVLGFFMLVAVACALSFWVVDIVELLNAQTLLANARAEMVQSRTNMFTSYADLIHPIGA